MHDPIKPGVGPILAGVLAHLTSVLEVLIFVVPAVQLVLEFLVAGAGEKQTGGEEEEESGWAHGQVRCVLLFEMEEEDAAHLGDGFAALVRSVLGAKNELGLDTIQMSTGVGHDTVGAFGIGERESVFVSNDGVDVKPRAKGNFDRLHQEGGGRGKVIDARGQALFHEPIDNRIVRQIALKDGEGIAEDLAGQTHEPTSHTADKALRHGAAAMRCADEDDAADVGIGLELEVLFKSSDDVGLEPKLVWRCAENIDPETVSAALHLKLADKPAHAVSDEDHVPGGAMIADTGEFLMEKGELLAEPGRAVNHGDAAGVSEEVELVVFKDFGVGAKLIEGIVPGEGARHEAVNEDDRDAIGGGGLKGDETEFIEILLTVAQGPEAGHDHAFFRGRHDQLAHGAEVSGEWLCIASELHGLLRARIVHPQAQGVNATAGGARLDGGRDGTEVTGIRHERIGFFPLFRVVPACDVGGADTVTTDDSIEHPILGMGDGDEAIKGKIARPGGLDVPRLRTVFDDPRLGGRVVAGLHLPGCDDARGGSGVVPTRQVGIQSLAS
jgi:hypothetical protein